MRIPTPLLDAVVSEFRSRLDPDDREDVGATLDRARFDAALGVTLNPDPQDVAEAICEGLSPDGDPMDDGVFTSLVDVVEDRWEDIERRSRSGAAGGDE